MKLNQILFSINFPDSILMVSLKGYSTPKLQSFHYSLTRTPFQLLKSFVRLRNTN